MATVEPGISAKDNQLQKPPDGKVLEKLSWQHGNICTVAMATIIPGISAKHNQLQKLKDGKISEMLPRQHLCMETSVLLPWQQL